MVFLRDIFKSYKKEVNCVLSGELPLLDELVYDLKKFTSDQAEQKENDEEAKAQSMAESACSEKTVASENGRSAP